MAEKFTAEQIKHFHKYEGVRQEGLFNMFDPQAMRLTGLDREEFFFVMSNYSELGQAANAAACKVPTQDMGAIMLEEEQK